MNLKQLKDEINQLALSEKLLLVEYIWDSIATNNLDLPFDEWQKKQLDARYKEYQDGKLELHDWAVVHEQFRTKYQ